MTTYTFTFQRKTRNASTAPRRSGSRRRARMNAFFYEREFVLIVTTKGANFEDCHAKAIAKGEADAF